MSHELEIRENGTAAMAYTGKTPWHGLGQKLDDTADITEWQKAAGLVWHVEAVPCMFNDISKDETFYNTFENRNVLVRSDNGTPFDVVSDKYKIVQPKQIMEFFRDLISDIGGFRMSTAGSLFNGKKIWGLAESVNDDAITLAGNDKINRYLLLSTSYDRTAPTVVQQTSVRVVCNNTLQASLSRGGILKMSHLTEFNMTNVREQMELDNNWNWFVERLNILQEKEMTEKQARDFFTEWTYPDALETKTSEEYEKLMNNNRIEALMKYRETSPGANLKSAKNTAWGTMSAVTYYLDHECRSKTNEARLDKTWFGNNAKRKGEAFDMLLSL